jgi:hypothetical protein
MYRIKPNTVLSNDEPIYLHIFTTCCVFCVTCCLTTAQPVALSLSDLAPDTTDVRWSYTLNHEGDSVGYAHVEISYLAGQYKLREVTRVEGFTETIVVRGAVEGLQPFAVVVTGESGGHGIDCQLQIGSRVTGYARYPDHPDHPMRTIDTAYIPNLLERTSSFFLYLPLMPFDSLEQIAFKQLNPLSCTLHDIVVTNTGSKQVIRTAAGSFETARIEFRGGQAAQNFYISTTTPRTVVRIEFEELPWRYELTSVERGEINR